MLLLINSTVHLVRGRICFLLLFLLSATTQSGFKAEIHGRDAQESLRVQAALLDLTLSATWQTVVSFNRASDENTSRSPPAFRRSAQSKPCLTCLGLMLLESMYAPCRCKHAVTPSSRLQRWSHMTENERRRKEQGAIDRQSNKPALKERQMKGKRGLRLEGERRKRYVILCWMNTAELFMPSQSETSKPAANIAHLSSFLSFVFSVREAVCKSEAHALVRYCCSCLKNTQVPRFINCQTFASSARKENIFLFLHRLCLLRRRFSLWEKNIAALWGSWAGVTSPRGLMLTDCRNRLFIIIIILIACFKITSSHLEWKRNLRGNISAKAI